MAKTINTFTPCPHTKQPFAECAANAITGASIPRISRYCMGDYSLCPVYSKKHERPVFDEVLNSIATETIYKERRKL